MNYKLQFRSSRDKKFCSSCTRSVTFVAVLERKPDEVSAQIVQGTRVRNAWLSQTFARSSHHPVRHRGSDALLGTAAFLAKPPVLGETF